MNYEVQVSRRRQRDGERIGSLPRSLPILPGEADFQSVVAHAVGVDRSDIAPRRNEGGGGALSVR